MTVSFLLPEVSALPTGGNVYNRRIMRALPEHITVRRAVGFPEETEEFPEGSSDAVVVDSLLMHQDWTFEALETLFPSASHLLLVHYLHLIDPRQSATEEAQVEQGRLDRFDGYITTSRFAKRQLARCGIAEKRIVPVAPGLADAYREPPSQRQSREQPHLLTVASLTPTKRILELIDVAETLADLDWTWDLVGSQQLDSEYAERVRRRLDASPVAEADRMQLRGSLSAASVRAAYDAADLLVHPSQFETCSMVVREAMARGLPVVAFAVGGVPDNLPDTKAGHLAPAGDFEALSSAVRTLLQDAGQRRAMGRAARQASRAFPSWEESADKMAAALEQLAHPS